MSFQIAYKTFAGKRVMPAKDQLKGTIEQYKKEKSVKKLTVGKREVAGKEYDLLSFVQENEKQDSVASEQHVYLVLIPKGKTMYYISFSYTEAADKKEAERVRERIFNSIKE